jgi:hypothetical protein
VTIQKSKARQKFLPLAEPAPTNNIDAAERDCWIDKLCNEFVQPSMANKMYYRVVVQLLWPEGSNIPGPHVTEDQIRNAIDQYRKENNFGRDPNKPYIDVFRRVRELQGEEGLVGVARQGKVFQLVDLELGPKRVPRTSLSNADWQKIKMKYGETCAGCKREEPDVRFQQDHKIPRTREGGDNIENWQPLCDECNNFKSVSCRACELDCNKCCWAFPETYSPIILSPNIQERIYEHCVATNTVPSLFVQNALIEKLEKNE